MTDASETRTVNGVVFTRSMRRGRGVWSAGTMSCDLVEEGEGYKIAGSRDGADFSFDFRVLARKAMRRRKADVEKMRAEVRGYDEAVA